MSSFFSVSFYCFCVYSVGDRYLPISTCYKILCVHNVFHFTGSATEHRVSFAPSVLCNNNFFVASNISVGMHRIVIPVYIHQINQV